MSIGHTYMYDKTANSVKSRFPPAAVPKLPDDFEHWDGENLGVEEEEEEEEPNGGEGLREYRRGDEMDEHESRWYAEMYES